MSNGARLSQVYHSNNPYRVEAPATARVDIPQSVEGWLGTGRTNSTVGGTCSSIGGGDGGTAARGGCFFVNDPNISFETKRNVAVGGLVLMTGGSALSLVPEAMPFLALGLGVQGVADGLPLGSGYVRVGRWMSEAEHNAMVATGRVQESTLNGVTSVSSPPNASAWIRQTTAPRYVEFDVPAGAVRPGVSPNAKIYGPNSIFGPRLGISEMPPALNITWTVCRVPMTCAVGVAQ